MIRLIAAVAPLALFAAPVAAQDGHAGHGQTPPVPASVPATAPPVTTPPATTPPTPDPHAGHDMSTMAGMPMPPDVATSADNPGRPPEDPIPQAALSGPAHAADAVFGEAAMAAAREQLRAEQGDMRTTALVLDRAEIGLGEGDEIFLWDAQGWTGGDINRFWWKTEGEGDFGDGVEEAEIQALYSRAVSPFWDVQLGVRQDFRRDADDATHLVLGLQGLAPYWWEIDGAAFLSTDGDLTARVEAEYDLRLTQRWILQPRFELEASAADAPDRELATGLSRVEAGLRLRYEIQREFAPYVGVEWSGAVGDTADLVEAAGRDADDVRFIIGLRAWY